MYASGIAPQLTKFLFHHHTTKIHMKNLEKMRAQFEKDFRCATIENELEERFGICFSVLENILEGGVCIFARGECQNGVSTAYIQPHDAAVFLNSFPADKPIPLDATAAYPDGTTTGMYRVRAERGYRDTFTKLRVDWRHDGNTYEFALKIDGNESLEQFFYNSQRKLSSIERDVYKPMRRGRIVRDLDLPIKEFMCAHMMYSGGYQSATDVDEIENIINTIKSF